MNYLVEARLSFTQYLIHELQIQLQRSLEQELELALLRKEIRRLKRH